jgi:hypothetical protein
MRSSSRWILALVLAAGSWNVYAGCGQGNGCGEGNGCDAGNGPPGSCVIELPTGEKNALTKKDRKGILFMHEEEKLARDVYRHLGRKWDLRPFQNIQRSEQAHIDAMAQLIERYELKARSSSDDEGTFANRALQKLYSKLIVDGEASAIAALNVGAYVEEVDIEDLDDIIASTRNPDLKSVAESLRRASENHLRAFVRNLAMRDVAYTPEILTAEVYGAIIGGEHSSGPP